MTVMPTTSMFDGYPRRSHGVVVIATTNSPQLRTVDGTTVCEVNETALALWQLCDGTTTAEEMIDGVCALFSNVRHVVVEDVDRALRKLTDLGLIEWTAEPAPVPEESLA